GTVSRAPVPDDRPAWAMNHAWSGKVCVRYMSDDVAAAIDFYMRHFDFTLEHDAAPAFASITCGNLRLLLSGPKSSGRHPLSDGTRPTPGGWNRIQLPVADLASETARLRGAGLTFRREDIVSGP